MRWPTIADSALVSPAIRGRKGYTTFGTWAGPRPATASGAPKSTPALRSMPPGDAGEPRSAGPVGPSEDAPRIDRADRLRIAFFTDSFPPTHDGVAELTAALGAELSVRGHHVAVFTVRSPGQPRREVLPNGVTVHRHLSVPAPGYPQYRMACFPYAPVVSLRQGYDVVHVHTPGFVGLAGWLAAKGSHIPSVGTFHSDLTGMLAGVGKTSVTRAFFRSWARFSMDLCLHCDVATAPTSTACRQLTAALVYRSHPRMPRVIENGIDVQRFRPGVTSPDWHARLGAPRDRPLVTFLGRLTRDKGVLRFLDAVEGIPPDVPFFVVVGGSGPLESEVAGRFGPGRPMGSRGRYLGAVDEGAKSALLAQSGIFVLPSLSDTSSLALLEAMACGAACVVSRRGGAGELARRSGAAVLVDPEDIQSMRRAIRDLLGDPRRTASLSDLGVSWVSEEASIQRTATLFERLYREIQGAERAAPDP